MESWYNYKTQQYEEIETPKDFRDYIPQIQEAQGLYNCYLEMGEAPIQTVINVLLCVPSPENAAQQGNAGDATSG